MKIAASIMCANQLELSEELRSLENAKVDLLHCDVMDGVFVNNLAMGPYILEEIKKSTTIPLDIHLATIEPTKYINMFKDLKPEYISFHYEASYDIKKDIQLIRDNGIKPALAISPSTPVESIKEYLKDIDMLLVMTVEPGFAGQKFNKSVLSKLEKLESLMEGLDNKPLIEVDGCINLETIPLIKNADVYVLGTSALFNDKDESYERKIESIKRII